MGLWSIANRFPDACSPRKACAFAKCCIVWDAVLVVMVAHLWMEMSAQFQNFSGDAEGSRYVLGLQAGKFPLYPFTNV